MTIKETEELGGIERPLGRRVTLLLGEWSDVSQDYINLVEREFSNKLGEVYDSSSDYTEAYNKTVEFLGPLPAINPRHKGMFHCAKQCLPTYAARIFDVLYRATNKETYINLYRLEGHSDRVQRKVIKHLLETTDKPLLIHTHCSTVFREIQIAIMLGTLKLEDLVIYVITDLGLVERKLEADGRLRDWEGFPLESETDEQYSILFGF